MLEGEKGEARAFTYSNGPLLLFPPGRTHQCYIHLVLRPRPESESVVLHNGNNNNEKHFKNLRSLHSWMGLLTIILVGLQWLIGSLAFYVPRESAVMTSIAPHLVRIRHAHRYAGVAIVAMSGFTAVAGTLENLTFLNVCEGEEIKGECVLGNLFGLGVAALAISTLSLFVSHAPPASPYTRVAAPATGSRVGVSLSSSSFSSEDERIGVGLLEGEEEDETREGLVYDDDDDVDDSEETG